MRKVGKKGKTSTITVRLPLEVLHEIDRLSKLTKLRPSVLCSYVLQEKMHEYNLFRQQSQPPGASMGSMFKNPPKDHAGRLIDQAGLKGTRVGDAEISSLHANFFINHGKATALEVYQLIDQAREIVKEKFDVELELEIQLFGDWKSLISWA